VTAGPDPADVAAVRQQLGRPPRALLAVAHRCRCGLPDVVQTAPRLPGGTPFPTLYYLTCVRARAAASRLEAAGVMRELNRRLDDEPGLREQYGAAAQAYRAARDHAARLAGVPPLPDDAPVPGGMPERVKCLHALAAQELAVPGSNPLGREAILAMGQWWKNGPCVAMPGTADGGTAETVHGPDCGTAGGGD
jgi:uncharacterized protein